ncbi:tRNA isopentenyl-2-thiomethyl-A-37 hydroxylase MiaE [Paraferrimonas sedimenticola]|uniref:tRNA-(Ms[2]io[6]A)-hydroxylase n=1 Tax=Paraferrimonas sedimenticola TaxID=375674 RepID=A0AA37VX60_9GAMM|nr:tRNA isopentenyl-2-thiomethyl-A-37 hydroxylase MiaE [Paraferrimonas sedimenticola]GLP96566.1 tRNA-(ms[2]io[6]A)-hydroxylase [Paraferrimonas sedimenticola]
MSSDPIQKLLAPVHEFLHCATPNEWIAEARRPEHLPALLVDHMNCELKAAQTAIMLLRKYAVDKNTAQALAQWAKPFEDMVYFRRYSPELAGAKNGQIQLVYKQDNEFNREFGSAMMRLIKEEFHHFVQVLEILEQRDIPYHSLSAGRYAKGLMRCARTHEPATLVDKLIIGGLIEARSCERFAKLAPFLDDELKQFYVSLLRSEARHFKDYLALANSVAGECIDARVQYLAAKEAELIQSSDPEFRFHSGSPLAEVLAS